LRMLVLVGNLKKRGKRGQKESATELMDRRCRKSKPPIPVSSVVPKKEKKKKREIVKADLDGRSTPVILLRRSEKKKKKGGKKTKEPHGFRAVNVACLGLWFFRVAGKGGKGKKGGKGGQL